MRSNTAAIERVAAAVSGAPLVVQLHLGGGTPTWLDDPQLAERRRTGVRAQSFAEQMAPLKNLQVWRFSLYYFFVFGAFVALALWLPRVLGYL